MINITNLEKFFGEVKVLEGINIEIKDGQIYGLIGRSGVGKSTLLRCINGLEKYNAGSLKVNGIEINSLKKNELLDFRKKIGMIFQNFSLLNRLDVYQNIALPLKCWKYSKEETDKKVKELLKLVGLEDKIHAKTRELSGGQKQRVAIARALALNPDILLCDEATSALDPKTAKSIIELLNRINKELGLTIIIVTHQMSVLRSICEEIAIIEDGKVAISGPVEEVFLKQSKPLKNIIGQKDYILPGEGHNLKIMLAGKLAKEPVITHMSRDLNIDFIIIGGEMENYRGKAIGSIIVNIKEVDEKRVTDYLNERDIKWVYMEKEELEI